MENNRAQDPIAIKIKATLDKLRPYLQQDGGDISFDAYDSKKGLVTITVLGNCNGCMLAGEEITYGVSQILKTEIPEVKEVKVNYPDGYNPASGMGGLYLGPYPTIDPLQGLRQNNIDGKVPLKYLDEETENKKPQ